MAEDKARKPRLSLTKTQLQAGVAAELLVLCQTITEDGRISDEEVTQLRVWLETHGGSDLPAIAFLRATVERILADGVVTREERAELHKAVESVLPVEARRTAVAERKRAEAHDEGIRRLEAGTESQQQRADYERKRPLLSVNFMVAGVHYEGREHVIRRFVEDGDDVFLIRDRANKYSRNAVEVRLRNGMQIGFVPEEDAVDVAPLLDSGCAHQAYVTKILQGGRVQIPVVQASLFRPDSGVAGIVIEADVPRKIAAVREETPVERKQKGCLSVILVPTTLVVVRALWG